MKSIRCGFHLSNILSLATKNGRKSSMRNVSSSPNSDFSNWKGCSMPPKDVVVGKWVVLEPFEPERHVDGLYNITMEEGAEERIKYLWDELPKSKAEFKQSLLDNWTSRHDRMMFVLYLKAKNKIIGRISYQSILPYHGRTEVGPYYYSRDSSGTAATYEASFLILTPAMENGYRRCEFRVWTKNLRSLQGAVRAGYNYEGLLKNAFIIKGQSRDDAIFSVTPDIYPLVKESSRIYVQEENVKPNGRHRRSLTEIRKELMKLDEFKDIVYASTDSLLAISNKVNDV